MEQLIKESDKYRLILVGDVMVSTLI